MIFSENLKLTTILCRMACTLGSIPIKFDRDSRRAQLLRNKQPSNLKFYFLTFLVAINALQCILKKPATLGENVLAWAGLTMLTTAQTFAHACRIKSQEIVLCINEFFNFEEIFGERQGRRVTLRTKLNLAFIKCAVITVILVPICFAFILHWTQPCKASLVGYFVLFQCHNQVLEKAGFFMETGSMLMKCLVMVLNQWMWTFGTHASLFCTALFQVMGVISLQECIQRYSNSI